MQRREEGKAGRERAALCSGISAAGSVKGRPEGAERRCAADGSLSRRRRSVEVDGWRLVREFGKEGGMRGESGDEVEA